MLNVLALLNPLNRVCALALTVFAGAATAGVAPATDVQSALGADLYADYCAGCHGDDLGGVQNFSDTPAAFARRLAGDTLDMPDFSDTFSPEEVQALYGFIATTVNQEQ